LVGGKEKPKKHKNARSHGAKGGAKLQGGTPKRKVQFGQVHQGVKKKEKGGVLSWGRLWGDFRKEKKNGGRRKLDPRLETGKGKKGPRNRP